MSYQVLARKWRPRTFAELVGQEHVLQALVNALDNDRLHHAYLFTGTRGVGKTTIARIFAKSLNCEQGVSAVSCGECSACVEIAEGRFVDLIEVDAASRTKVEDTRELLENVQYRPTRGRYKVYLIDEVHMLSGHSFNALLKTLEEPPPHVKFLLATTDPQKLPVTVLSRCLQFNLKHLGIERISDHLQRVLTAEAISFEEPALRALARAAEGSMRDALSLTDQAIAHGGGRVIETEVDAMLGTIDRHEVQALCCALVERDAAKVLAVVARMAEFSPDYRQVLAEMLGVWHRVAIAQQAPDAVDNSFGDHDLVMALASSVSPEDVQLFYQIGLLGRRDLPHAADLRSGFEMVLLRQLAFQPQGIMPPAGPPPGEVNTPPTVSQGNDVTATMVAAAVTPPAVSSSSSAVRGASATSVIADAIESLSAESPQEPTGRRWPDEDEVAVAPVAVLPAMSRPEESRAEEQGEEAVPVPAVVVQPEPIPRDSSPTAEPSGDLWLDLYPQLPLGGMLQSIASNLSLESREENVWHFIIDHSQSALFEVEHQQRLAEVLTDHLGSPQAMMIRVGEPGTETPARRSQRLRAERQRAAVATLRQDPMVIELLTRFGGELLEQTVVPRNA